MAVVTMSGKMGLSGHPKFPIRAIFYQEATAFEYPTKLLSYMI